MRVKAFIALFGLMGIGLVGCGDSATEGGSSSRALVEAHVAAYDRYYEVRCPCYVQLGAFESVEACMTLVGSGPSWVDCGTMVLDEKDSPELREQADCSLQETKARSACFEEAMCDPVKSAECEELRFCEQDNDLTVTLLERCPDFGLLSRPEAAAY